MTGAMRAAVFEGNGRLAITERPIPRIVRPDDVLIEVEACGICGTDVHILETPPGHPATAGTILGHEVIGIVRENGAEAFGAEIGDRVAVAPNLSCGACAWCRRGLTNHCENFTTLGIFRDGGLASFVVAPARACHAISRRLPREIAALAEPVSCVVNGIEQARLLPGEHVAIIGAGPIGLIFLALLRAAGAGRAVVVEPGEARRQLAKRLGADACVDPAGGPVAEQIVDALGGSGADVVVDAVGNQMATAIASARKGGRVLLFGMDANATREVRQFDITRNELTVFGTYVGANTFPRAIQALESGAVDLSPIVTDRVGLEQLPGAIEALRDGRAVKVVVDLMEEADA